jgi:sugar phosphate isomerase/epimerase
LFGDGFPGKGGLEAMGNEWTQVAEACAPAGLYLENTFEQTPCSLACLAARLPENCGVCFDVGHWYAVAGGVKKRNLENWLDTLEPFIRHLHLHDNHGIYDEHLALGRGNIDWDYFAALIAARKFKPGVTFETSFDMRDLLATRQYLTQHPKFRRALGLD